MRAPTWTGRCARMLVDELPSLSLESAAVAADGGIGTLAMSAILAAPAGVARNFEIGKWARRIAARDDSSIAFVVEPGRPEALLALAALDIQVAELRGRSRGMAVMR